MLRNVCGWSMRMGCGTSMILFSGTPTTPDLGPSHLKTLKDWFFYIGAQGGGKRSKTPLLHRSCGACGAQVVRSVAGECDSIKGGMSWHLGSGSPRYIQPACCTQALEPLYERTVRRASDEWKKGKLTTQLAGIGTNGEVGVLLNTGTRGSLGLERWRVDDVRPNACGANRSQARVLLVQHDQPEPERDARRSGGRFVRRGRSSVGRRHLED